MQPKAPRRLRGADKREEEAKVAIFVAVLTYKEEGKQGHISVGEEPADLDIREVGGLPDSPREKGEETSTFLPAEVPDQGLIQ